VSLRLTWLKEKLPQDLLSSLEVIRFCGTYGDPCTHPDLIEIIFWLRSVSPAKIFVSTNGGIRSTHWWRDLANALGSSDEVIFGIDGLRSTNHLYRKGVAFDKVITHAKAFIEQGGQATWQFLVFEHNQHQIEKARQMSKDLGFKNFMAKYTTRFVNKQHELVHSVPVLDGKKIFFLKLPTDPALVNPGYQQLQQQSDYKTVDINCISKKLSIIYIGADGYVFPCGFLADRLYGFEAENHPDHARMADLFERAGGAHMANLNFTKLYDIIHGPWFNVIESSWNDDSRLERCAHQCGKGNHLVTDIYTYMRGINQ
jgi:MoaA/NifB/PqqE/SkfB family radical SAM enzyme